MNREMKSRSAVIIILVSLCFCIGLGTVLLGEQTTASPISSIIRFFPEGGLAPFLNPERSLKTTVLILGIDRFDRPDPELKAIWLLTVQPPEKNVILSGVPTNLDLVEGANVTLESFFAWTPDKVVAPPFLEAIERALRVEVDIVVVMDEYAFSSMVDYLGGLPLEGDLGLPLDDHNLTGQQVLALHTVFASDPDSLVSLQANIIQGLIPQVQKLGANPDLDLLLALLPDHANVSIHEAQLAVLLSHLLPLDPELVEIQMVLSPIPCFDLIYSKIKTQPASGKPAGDGCWAC